MLGADELRILVGEGVELGGHSCTHPRLPDCTAAELSMELTVSREILSELGGRDVDTIAWPYGAHDERCRRAARAAGYRLGYAVAGDGPLLERMRRAIRPAARDPLAVPRREARATDSRLRRRLRMGPADGLFVAARKMGQLRSA